MLIYHKDVDMTFRRSLSNDNAQIRTQAVIQKVGKFVVIISFQNEEIFLFRLTTILITLHPRVSELIGFYRGGEPIFLYICSRVKHNDITLRLMVNYIQ